MQNANQNSGSWGDYNPEVSSGGSQFMKFENGRNRFRIVSNYISGWLVWLDTDDGDKPLRLDHRPTEDEMKKLGVRVDNGQRKAKYFTAFAVWNYKEEKVQVLEVTQVSVQKQISAYVQNEEYGNPTKYDITVTKSGESLKTEYSVLASPPKPLDPEIEQEVKEAEGTYNLDKLFEGEYPFDV